MKKRLQTRQDRIMTFANFISFSRIVLAFPLIYSFERMRAPDGSIVDYHYWLSLIILLVIVLSDFLDGFVARMADEITDFGKLIDPIADKILIAAGALFVGGKLLGAVGAVSGLLTIAKLFASPLGIGALLFSFGAWGPALFGKNSVSQKVDASVNVLWTDGGILISGGTPISGFTDEVRYLGHV